MEIPSIWFFPFFSFMTIIFLRIGLEAFDKATVSNPSEVLTNLFKVCIVFSVFYSSTYSFFCRPWLENKKPDTHVCYGPGSGETIVSFLCAKILLVVFIYSYPEWVVILASFVLLTTIYIPFLFPSLSPSKHTPVLPSIRMLRCHNYCGGLSIIILIKVGYNLSSSPIYSIGFLCLLILVSYTATVLRYHPSSKKWFSSFAQTAQTNTIVSRMYDKRKIIEWGLGILASIFYQYYFKNTTVHLMLSFLCFAVVWLGNLAMVQPITDLGIFNFLISNSVISSAVTLFGIGIHTWLVASACAVLVALRFKLESVSLVYCTDFVTS